jgi:hypothetical protein
MVKHGSAATARRAAALVLAAVARCWFQRTRCCHALLLVALAASLSPRVALAAPPEGRVALPVVPPPHVRFPAGFDEHGCALIAHDGTNPQRVCPVARSSGSSSSGTADWARYLGYEGPPADATVHGSGVIVVPDALLVASQGWWRATGLVRNDTPEPVREVRVTVMLATADDRPLGTTTTVVPVHDLRPGEPAPFELRTLIPAESARRVRWHVTTAGGKAAASSRLAEIEIGRIAPSPVAASRSLQTVVAIDATRGTPVGWGILRNWGPAAIVRPTVIGVWLDEKGRAVRIVDARMRPATVTSGNAAFDLLPGATVQFDLLDRGNDVVRPRGWRLALWQTTS